MNSPHLQILYPAPSTVTPLQAMGDALAAPSQTTRHSSSYIACGPNWRLGSAIIWAVKDAFTKMLPAHRGLHNLHSLLATRQAWAQD